MMILATAPRIRRLRGGAGDSTVTTGTAPRIRILRPEGAAQRGRRRDSSAHTEIKGDELPMLTYVALTAPRIRRLRVLPLGLEESDIDSSAHTEIKARPGCGRSPPRRQLRAYGD